ncbi:unnamed protein product [Cylicocyclus nassatus]|uniref:Uncharacterized protein n=1 Tax=Cylicocyclus nassatus TaxID=53992 RepID=A0AA36GJK1_CYLNA|nr:unnamed protein product [Cylicocyclus nassatus]
MDQMRNYKNPCESSSRNFTNFGLSAVYAAVHTFFGRTGFLESPKYVLDERPKRMASRLIQLSDEFDKELMPDDRCTCHILSYLLLLVRWLICY